MHDNPPRGPGITQVWFTVNDNNQVLSGKVGDFTALQLRAILDAVQHELDNQEAIEEQRRLEEDKV